MTTTQQGVVSGAMLLIARQFHLSDLQQEVVVSATIAGSIVGAVLGGRLNHGVGRRPVALLASVIFCVGAAVMALADGFTVLTIGRVLVGLGVGLVSMTIPMYIAEAAPPQHRGVLVTINNLFLTGGQAIASVVDGLFVDVHQGWRYMLGLSALPAVLMFIGFACVLPESPRWLMGRGRRTEAAAALARIRGKEDVADELDRIADTVKQDAPEARLRDLVATPSLRRALLLGCGMQALQQLTAINTVMYYSATILTLAGFGNPSDAIWLSAAVASCNFLFTIVGLYFVERSGRRRLTLVSLAGVAAALLGLGASFYFDMRTSPGAMAVEGAGACGAHATCYACVQQDACGFCAPGGVGRCVPGNDTDPAAPWMCALGGAGAAEQAAWYHRGCPSNHGWVAVLALMLYLAFFAPGMGTTPWTVNSEIYPLALRSLGNSVATAVNWSCNLLISMTFLTLTRWLTTYGAFWLYAGVAVVGWAFLYFHMPETRGKELEEIEQLFTHGASWRGDRAEDDVPLAASAETVHHRVARGSQA